MEREYSEDVRVDGIWTWHSILKKSDELTWSEYIWFRMMTSVGI
jgi:hypothetical protein